MWPHWDAYAATLVDIEMPDGRHVVLRASTADEVATGSLGAWPFGAETQAWIITACNPRSQLLTHEMNAERHEQMRAQLIGAGLEPHETVGRDAASDWLEPGFLVIGEVGPQIVELARAWQQNAVFRWTPNAFAIVGVLQPGEHSMPWALDAVVI